MKNDLVGKTFIYRYPDGVVFRTTFESADTVRWEGIEGPLKGKSAVEKYQSREVGPRVFFLHWIEADGTAVNEVVNLDKLSVAAALVFPPGPNGKVPTGVVLDGVLVPA